MTALLITVALASLVGSPHCAGMCGVFVAFATGAPDARAIPQRDLMLAYHGGRLLTYTLLGAITGAIGGAIQTGGALLGVQQAAAVAAGAIMVLFGLTAIARHIGLTVAPLSIHTPFKRLLMNASAPPCPCRRSAGR
ncbi:MAG: hypothetical protein GC162_14965 [Planctomycetes bacterium]|nr:hypothetical protein [Planctomycetota bacterium]